MSRNNNVFSHGYLQHLGVKLHHKGIKSYNISPESYVGYYAPGRAHGYYRKIYSGFPFYTYYYIGSSSEGDTINEPDFSILSGDEINTIKVDVGNFIPHIFGIGNCDIYLNNIHRTMLYDYRHF